MTYIDIWLIVLTLIVLFTRVSVVKEVFHQTKNEGNEQDCSLVGHDYGSWTQPWFAIHQERRCKRCNYKQLS
jgi:hypothetical protein